MDPCPCVGTGPVVESHWLKGHTQECWDLYTQGQQIAALYVDTHGIQFA